MSPNNRFVPPNEEATARIVKFFQLLDQWCREIEGAAADTLSETRLPWRLAWIF